MFLPSGGGALTNMIETFNGTFWSNDTLPPLPSQHPCMVAINQTLIMAIGSIDKSYTETAFYSSETGIWTSGPNLTVSRISPVCALMNWQNSSSGQCEKVVIVAGGFDISTGHCAFYHEYLNLNHIDAGWQKGPAMNETLLATAMVTFESSVIRDGGLTCRFDGVHDASGSILKLDSPDGMWYEMTQNLTTPRWNHVAYFVDDDLCIGK